MLTFARRLYRCIPVWAIVTIIVFPLRLFFASLPAPGRDEAAYFYWAHHFEPAYAPLMQFILRLFGFLPLPDLTAIRAPSILLGIIVLFLFDRILQLRGAMRPVRFIAVLCLGLTAWQTYAGVVVHPDNYQFVALLLFVLAVLKKQYFWSAVAAGLCVLAKPSGLIVLGVALIFFASASFSPRQKMLYFVTACGIALPALLSMHLEMVQAVSEYGKINAEASLGETIIWSITPTLFFGGPLLLFGALQGAREQFSTGAGFKKQMEEGNVAFWLGLAFIIVFCGAAVFRGQIKENWILPGFILLWPVSKLRIKSIYLASGLALTLIPAFIVIASLRFPSVSDNLAQVFSGLSRTYEIKSGAREARYSEVNSWQSRLREFQAIDDFSERALSAWHKIDGGLPRLIISDDYGLAAQLAFSWKKSNPQIVIPGDGIFFRTTPPATTDNLARSPLILAVHKSPLEIWGRLQNVRIIGQVRHPATNGFITLATCSRELLPSQFARGE